MIDEDLGLLGSTAVGREGFQKMLAEVALDHVGIIFGVEMSRLARSNKDWHQLVELCSRFGVLIADLSARWQRRSTRVTTHVALGKMVVQSLKSRLVVMMVEVCSASPGA